MKNEKIMIELENACRDACHRYPRDWHRAGRPAPADLIGAAWIKLQERGDGDAFRAACSALYAEAWQHSGHSVGGSVDHLTGLEDYDGAAASDRAESAAALNADTMRRDTESAALAGVILEDLAADPLDRAIIRAQLAGLTQAETAAALNVTRATVNRRLQAIRRRLEDAAKI